MGDIISRIRVEALGADQAAREILKLKDAYVAAGEAAKGLSANVGGGSDPFSKATAAGGGATHGGNSPYDVGQRGERDTKWRRDVEQRESKNKELVPRAIERGTSVAESISDGRGGSALKGLAGAASSLLGGPAGIALAAIGAAGAAVQVLSKKSEERMMEAYGGGMSQRLGSRVGAIDRAMVGFGEVGIPIGMVKSFYNTASQSGVNMGLGSTQQTIADSLQAAAVFGVDPSVSAGLLGSLNRGGVTSGNVLNRGMFSLANRSFGHGNEGMFLQGMQGIVDSRSSRGINQTSPGTQNVALMQALLAGVPGMAPQGAVALTEKLMNRGESAASLSNPEDIIAFMSMRGSGKSVTETMLAMEQKPEDVNSAVYEYMKSAYGGNEDALNLGLQQYLGAGTTMSQVTAWRKSQEEYDSMTPAERKQRLSTTSELEHASEKYEEERNSLKYSQNSVLNKTEDYARGMSERLMKGFLEAGGNMPLSDDPRTVTEWGALRVQPDAQLKIDKVQEQTIQNLDNLYVYQNSVGAEHGVGAARNASANTELYNMFGTLQDLKSDESLRHNAVAAFTYAGNKTTAQLISEGKGGVSSNGNAGTAGDLLSALIEKSDKKGPNKKVDEEMVTALLSFLKLDRSGVSSLYDPKTQMSDATFKELLELFAQLIDTMGKDGAVKHTDGMGKRTLE